MRQAMSHGVKTTTDPAERRPVFSGWPGSARALFCSILALVAILLAATPGVQAAERIFPQDRLSLKVLEWLPAKGTFKEWEGVTGEYAVAQDQTIIFPFLGSVSTIDRTTNDLASFISLELQQRMSLPLPPDVTVSFAVRAPVYILGGVQAPGQFPYSSDLTATKAIALAGGFFRGAGGDLRLERDVISSEAALETAENEAALLVAKLGRLEAEAVDGTEVLRLETPAPVEPTDAMVAQEQSLLDVRLEARQSRLESTRNRRKLAEDQLKSLQDRIENLQTQIGLINKELASVKKLVGQGLAVASRSLTLERNYSELQGKQLELDVAQLQAQLEANQAERDAVEFVATFRTEVANDAQLARAELSQRVTDIDTAKKLLHEATTIAPEALVERDGRMQIGVRIVLTRRLGSRTVTSDISKDEPLFGGDTIQVELGQRPDATAGVDAAGDGDTAVAVQ